MSCPEDICLSGRQHLVDLMPQLTQLYARTSGGHPHNNDNNHITIIIIHSNDLIINSNNNQ